MENLRVYPVEQIASMITDFSTRSGVEIIKLIKPMTTFQPSIQGHWNCFTNSDYNINKKLDWKTIDLKNAWDYNDISFSKRYRKHEKDKIVDRPSLTYEEKSELPLGKWGPVLDPEY